MPDYDASFKIVARSAGRELSTLAGVTCQEWEPIGETVQTAERLADRAFRARQGRERFVVYLEAYTRWDPAAPWSVLAKSGLLSERERLPTLSLVFILLRRGYRRQGGQFRLEALAAPTQQVWFREVCLWEQQPQPWWEATPGLMALYPLCLHGQGRREAVAHAAQAIQSHERDSSIRADLLTTLAIFGKLVYPGLDVLGLIGRQAMKESKAYQEIMEEGALERARTDVAEVITVRFGAEAAAEFQGALQALDDAERLSELHRLAIRSRRLSELRRGFAAAADGR